MADETAIELFVQTSTGTDYIMKIMNLHTAIKYTVLQFKKRKCVVYIRLNNANIMEKKHYVSLYPIVYFTRQCINMKAVTPYMSGGGGF